MDESLLVKHSAQLQKHFKANTVKSYSAKLYSTP